MVFEPTEETFHILSVWQPLGDKFKLLGVDFDTSLSIDGTFQKLTHAAVWKLKMLIRTHRYFNISELVILYDTYVVLPGVPYPSTVSCYL